MAEIIELQDEVGNASNITDEGTTPDAEATSPAQPEAVAVPEKYRGKSLDEIVKMHQEAEKLIGRQAQEVGEVRKLADDLIKQQLNTPKHDVQPSVIQEIDWYEDPAKAVSQAVENNPAMKQMQEQLANQAKQSALATIEKAHPDFISVAQSEDFASWIQGSKIRMQTFAQANNYDVESALDLLSTYKELKGIKQQQAKTADDSLKKADDAARTTTLKAATVQKGGTGETSKPVYRRPDLIRLRMTDPERYMSMESEILQAYAEGRVR